MLAIHGHCFPSQQFRSNEHVRPTTRTLSNWHPTKTTTTVPVAMVRIRSMLATFCYASFPHHPSHSVYQRIGLIGLHQGGSGRRLVWTSVKKLSVMTVTESSLCRGHLPSKSLSRFGFCLASISRGQRLKCILDLGGEPVDTNAAQWTHIKKI